jgi:DNA-binding transcriptional regulator YiaG
MVLAAKDSSARRTMTREQSRAARSWLGWWQADLATRANVSVNTVRNFEGGQKTPTANNLAAMRRAIETAGLRLLFDKTGSAAGIARQDADLDLSAEPSD